MRHILLAAAAVIALTSAVLCRAGDLGINVVLSGQVAPGVYGQVQIGNAPPPPLVYAQPVLVERVSAPPPAVYLHVPPGHAKHWSKYCHEYHACNRPVYFVRSAEYEPGYAPNHHGHDENDHDHHDKHDHD
jgi:hypothetical protein